uniref:uncharacterized protein LOC108590381 isoform X16 n=1 Tax=Callithrix jacchus TaxID=9483 RepID=UPI0023DD60CB|nr:uncharacterized protein LOC108590381 isoform X16 [Callithrix jacchus]
MGNCLGSKDDLGCAYCMQAVLLCCETQVVDPTQIATTTAEPAILHSGVAEVQHVQPIKRRKGLAGRARSWLKKKWRHKKICPIENEAPVEEPKECKTLFHLTSPDHETSPDIENATDEYQHTPVDDSEECTHGSKKKEVASDMEKPAAQYHNRPAKVLQDLIIEDIEDDELFPDVEKPAAQYHHRPAKVLQDLIIEDIEDDELFPDVEKPAAQYHHRPAKVLQDLIIEDIEDDELFPDVEKPEAQYHHRPVKVLQDLIIEDIEDDELFPDVEKPAAQYHHRPAKVLQDLIIEDIEDDELFPDVDTVTAPSDLPPPEDCRSITSEDDVESSSLGVYVSSNDQASTVGLRSWTEEEDLEEEDLYRTSQERARSWILGSNFKPHKDDPQGSAGVPSEV